MLLLVILLVLLNLTVLGVILYYVVKKFSSPTIVTERVIEKQNSSSMEDSVREGMKSALRELEDEKEAYRQMREVSKRRSQDMGIYTTQEGDIPIEGSKGELVQFGMTDDEKRILNMFYND